jgi:hypothetical protein
MGQAGGGNALSGVNRSLGVLLVLARKKTLADVGHANN